MIQRGTVLHAEYAADAVHKTIHAEATRTRRPYGHV